MECPKCLMQCKIVCIGILHLYKSYEITKLNIVVSSLYGLCVVKSSVCVEYSGFHHLTGTKDINVFSGQCKLLKNEV